MSLDITLSLDDLRGDRISTSSGTIRDSSSSTVYDKEPDMETRPDRDQCSSNGPPRHPAAPRNAYAYIPEWNWQVHYHLQCQATIAGMLGFRGVLYRATQWAADRDSAGRGPSPRPHPRPPRSPCGGDPSGPNIALNEDSTGSRASAARTHTTVPCSEVSSPSSGGDILCASTALCAPTAGIIERGAYEAIVTFQEVAVTRPGETVFVVGSIPQLGSWNVENAVPLSADKSYPLWSGTVHTPPATSFEYKFIKRTSDGSVVWEEAPNHSATIPTGGVHILQTSWP